MMKYILEVAISIALKNILESYNFSKLRILSCRDVLQRKLYTTLMIFHVVK